MNDLAEAIVRRAYDLENAEDVSYLKLSINMSKNCFFQITKSKRFVRITNKEKGLAYRLNANKEFPAMLKHVWRLVIVDAMQGVLRECQVIDKGVGIGWGLSKEGPFGLIECVTETIAGPISKTQGIETLVSFACLVSSPGLSLEKA